MIGLQYLFNRFAPNIVRGTTLKNSLESNKFVSKATGRDDSLPLATSQPVNQAVP